MQKMMLERAEANYKSQLASLDRAIVIKETLERKLGDSDVVIIDINNTITKLNEARVFFLHQRLSRVLFFFLRMIFFLSRDSDRPF